MFVWVDVGGLALNFDSADLTLIIRIELTSHAAHPDRGVRSLGDSNFYYVRDAKQGFRATPLIPRRDFERLLLFHSGISSDSYSYTQGFRATRLLALRDLECLLYSQEPWRRPKRNPATSTS